jgi:hypothetical protein
VARRPESETILSREQLAEFTSRLQMLSDDGVERIYETPIENAGTNGRNFRQPPLSKQLVAAWKVLRKFRAMSG